MKKILRLNARLLEREFWQRYRYRLAAGAMLLLIILWWICVHHILTAATVNVAAESSNRKIVMEKALKASLMHYKTTLSGSKVMKSHNGFLQ